MHILIVHIGPPLPVSAYGGTERVVWDLGKALVELGQQVSFLATRGSSCNFAKVIAFNPTLSLGEQIPSSVDIVHFSENPQQEVGRAFVITQHNNLSSLRDVLPNTIFLSRDHANRHGSGHYVYNGLDWSRYRGFDLSAERQYFHFLADASKRRKNVNGAIRLAHKSGMRLSVIGGSRFYFRRGFRLTLSRNISFHGMVNDLEKSKILPYSMGLLFPVLWHEPFGLAIIESLYFGCPVFGTTYGSLPELIGPQYGYLANSATQLLRAMHRVGEWSPCACHSYARDNFSSRVMALGYLNYYQRVLSGETLNADLPVKAVLNRKMLPWGN